MRGIVPKNCAMLFTECYHDGLGKCFPVVDCIKENDQQEAELFQFPS
jgi:hypothetical protein